MNANDVLETRLRLEAQAAGARRIDPPRPPADDAGDGLIFFSSDPLDNFIAGDFAQGFDLLGDRDGDARHAEASPGPELVSVQRRGMQQKADRGSWRCVRVTHV